MSFWQPCPHFCLVLQHFKGSENIRQIDVFTLYNWNATLLLTYTIYSNAQINIIVTLLSQKIRLYTGCIKKCPKYKIASKLDICKITDNQQQPTANIGHWVCISVNFVFISSISEYGMLLLICKKKMIRRKY